MDSATKRSATASIDVKDAYSTDAKIAENDLVALARRPRVLPAIQSRLSLSPRACRPAAVDALQKLAGTLDEARMIRLNAEAERTERLQPRGRSLLQRSARHARMIDRHRSLAISLAGPRAIFSSPAFRSCSPIIVGVPLGIVASRGGALGHAILAFTSAVQTIPSLALLALLVPLPFFGISARTAIAALFLYGLLPIVRNTATGLQDIAQPIRESAIALGLTRGAQLRQIYLPMASRTILAGIKTSAVINIGTATLAALIGAGGLGEPIISGLNLNDHATILQGAIPAAVLALLVQWSFDLLDRLLIPKGLRL